MADSTQLPRPGDTDNNLLRKITTLLADGLDVDLTGGTVNVPGNVTTNIPNGSDIAQGSIGDAQMTNSSNPGTVVGISKGIFQNTLSLYIAELNSQVTLGDILTGIGTPGASAVTNPASSASVIAALKGILTEELLLVTNTGAVADAAVTNPASSASVIAVLKGILTAVNVPAVGGTSSTTINSSIATTNSSLTTISGKIDTLNTTVAATGQQRGSLTNRSGSIAAGATSQQVAALNASRKYFLFQNISTETMWINFGTAAVSDQPSIQVLQGGSFVMENFFVSTEAINVISATTGSKFVSKEA